MHRSPSRQASTGLMSGQHDPNSHQHLAQGDVDGMRDSYVGENQQQPRQYNSFDQDDPQRFGDDGVTYQSDEDDEGLGHTRLFVIIEEGMPRPNESRQLTTTEAAQRRELIEQTWERVRKWLWDHQDVEERAAAASVRGTNDATPLHNVCKLYQPPADIVQALLEAAPETITWADSHGWLPLHHACANGATGEVLRILTEAYPEGKTKQDSQLRTPLHFYLTQRSDNPNAMAQNMTFLSNTGAAELPDVGGMLPMHYACAYGVSPAVLAVLADAYPDSIHAKENKGRTPMHLAMVNAHRDASPGVIKFLLAQSGGASSELVTMRDHDGFLPLHLLALGLRGFRADEPGQRNNVSECLKMYLDAEPTTSADFLTALQDLPDWLQDVAVVSQHVRNVLNKKIVQRFSTSILMLDGYWLLLIIIFFEIATREHIRSREQLYIAPLNSTAPTFSPAGVEEAYSDTNQSALVPIFLGGIWFFLRELVQIISLWYLGSVSSWFFDPTNWLDMCVIVLTFYYAIVMTNDDFGDNDRFRSGVAFTKGVLWLDVIYFLKSTLVDFAVFVGGVFYVLRRLTAFLSAVAVILLAFAQMFFIVYTETEICTAAEPMLEPTAAPTEDSGDDGACDFPHCKFPSSLLKVYTMMMGEIGDEGRYETKLIAQILYVLYAFLVVILLSNVLIAIVTDSYEIVQNDRAAIVFWSNRLDFVAEMDQISSAFLQRIKGLYGSKGANPQIQEGPSGAGLVSHDTTRPEDDIFYEGWKSIVQLFDQNLYDDVDLSPQNIEFWCYFFFRFAAVIFVIPLWVIAGLLTFGWLWPPQVREYLLVQKETAISRADLEKQKLEQLKEIQTNIKSLKTEIKKEMAADREDMARLKNEVDAVHNEVMSDLQQVRELMTTLLDMGRNRR